MIILLLVEVGKRVAVGSIIWMLLALAVSGPARAEPINPLDGKGLPIPGDLGMEYFYGEWMPWGDADALVFKSATFHRDGHITRDLWFPDGHAKDPPELFKLVAWDKKTVLLAARSWNRMDNEFYYNFWSLTLRNTERAKIPALYWGSCSDRRFGETEWQMTPKKIFAFFKQSRPCNPSLNRSSEKYPWDFWSSGYY